MKKLAALMIVLAGCLAGTAGGDRFDPDALAARIAPWVADDTFIVGHVNTAKISAQNVAELLDKLEKLDILPGDRIKEARAVLQTCATTLAKAKVKSLYILSDFSRAHEEPLLVIPLAGGEDKEAVLGWLRGLGLTAAERDGAILAGHEGQVKRAERQPRKDPELAAAFAAAGDALYQFVVRPPTALRRALAETLPQLPKEFGDVPWAVVDKGVLWIAHGVDLTPKVKVRLVVQSLDAASAKAMATVVGNSFDFARACPDLAWLAQDLGKFQDALLPKVEKDRLVLTLDEETLLPMLAPIAVRARREADRAQNFNNLKQLALAMHNYHDTYKSFPPAASRDAQGKKLLSWRVHVLPFIEQEELYKQFKLDEPWDSAHNKALIEKMPALYKTPQQKNADGKTRYQVPVGKDTIFEGDKGISLRDISDGTSNTILIVEAAQDRAVIWTKPDDWEFNPKEPLKGLVDAKAKGFNVSLADGSVRHVAADIALDTLRALFTRSGGEVVQLD